MTRFADPLVISCPHCHAPLLEAQLRSLTNYGSVSWSDGHVDMITFCHTGSIAKCDECNKLFWLEDAEKLGQMIERPMTLEFSLIKRIVHRCLGSYERHFRNEAAWLKLPSSWKRAIQIVPPKTEDLVAALDSGFADRPERERYLRRQLWWACNDPDRGYKRNSPFTPEQARENMTRLLSLYCALPEEERQVIKEGELLRELGRFDEAAEILKSLAGENPEAAIIRNEAIRKNHVVCKVKEVTMGY